MLNIAIIGDESKKLLEYENTIPEWLNKNNIEGNIVLATPSPSKFLDAIAKGMVNVCIIDINLRNEINGMHLARQIRSYNSICEIIFVTGCLDFIQQAFDVRAYNFIQKPGWEALEKTLIKISKEQSPKQKRCIDLKCGSEIYFIQIDDISHIEHIQSKTVVYSKSGIYSTYEGLEELINRISDTRFKQCRRSIFVNVSYLHCIDIKHKCLILTNEFRCDIGPKYFSNFKTQDVRRKLPCL